MNVAAKPESTPVDSVPGLYYSCHCHCTAGIQRMFAYLPPGPAAQRPPSQSQQYQAAAAPAGSSSHGLGHAIGGLFKKLAVGGSSGGVTHTGMSSGGGFGRMGGMGLGGLGRNDDDNDYDRQLREQQMTQVGLTSDHIAE